MGSHGCPFPVTGDSRSESLPRHSGKEFPTALQPNTSGLSKGFYLSDLSVFFRTFANRRESFSYPAFAGGNLGVVTGRLSRFGGLSMRRLRVLILAERLG